MKFVVWVSDLIDAIFLGGAVVQVPALRHAHRLPMCR
jgi:hypothetical protein